MTLATSSISQLERAQIDQEWQEERAYPLANLSTARTHRRGLRFVKATKSDEEWSRECRESKHNSWLSTPTSKAGNDDEISSFYRNLARRSGTSTPTSTMDEDTPIARAAKRRRREQGEDMPYQNPNQPLASTSKLTLEDVATELNPVVKLSGQGSKEFPLELDEESEGEGSIVAEEQEDIAEQPYQGDMYCLICKLLIPSSDVPSHPTSIRHQLAKTPSHTTSNPLIPPIQYALRASTNVGYSMLQRLGWVEENGLGKSVQGRKTPIRPSEKYDRTGLGVENKRRRMIEEQDGRILSRKEEEVLKRGKKVAVPLAKNKKDMEKSRKREMQFFKDGLAYLHS